MATLNTFAEVDAELAATADYDVEIDTSKARRRIAALRRKLDFASSSERNGTNIEYQQQIIQQQLQQAIAWLQANDTANHPSVIHADFGTFRG